MSDPVSATRRRILGLLAGLPAWVAGICGPSSAQDQPSDRGIGGTGARPPEDETPGSDRGIGGTGVIGTIRRFGSIVVNDLRITYPRDASVRIDGAPARLADLRIGHVVRVIAQGSDGALSTRAIDVTSEVVGPVEAVGKGRLTVLGQSVTTASLKGGRAWTVGERVAVSGLRRADGTIVASLIEARGEGPARVAGPVRKGSDGVPMIGALKLDGLRAGLVGRRAVVEGRAEAGGLAVASARDASRPFPAGLARASIEGYAVREGGALRLGSGLRMVGAAGLAPGGARAIVTAVIARDGRLTAEAVRVEGRGGPPSPGAPDPGGRGGPSGNPRGNLPGGPQGGPSRGGSDPGRSGPAPARSDGPGRGFGAPSGQGPGRDPGIDTRPVPGVPSDGFGGGPGGGPGGGFGGGGFGGQGGPGGPGLGGGGGPGGGFGGGGPGGPGGGGRR